MPRYVLTFPAVLLVFAPAADSRAYLGYSPYKHLAHDSEGKSTQNDDFSTDFMLKKDGFPEEK